METYAEEYLKSQKATLDTIPTGKVGELIEIFQRALAADKKFFVIGNGGSAANASHFVTDLGKSASDKVGKPFRIMSLGDNTPWITAISNDYDYSQIFTRQLVNYAEKGDIVFAMSVSGNSPNTVHAVEWAKANGVFTICLVGNNRGRLAELGDFVIVIDSAHYGRVEDAHMAICHMICYAFIEGKVSLL